MRRRLLQTTALALVACARPIAPPVPRAAAPAPHVEVRVTHSAPDHMHVEYTFPEPTAEITFSRPSTAVRASWTSPVPGVKVMPDRATAPAPMREWTFDLVVDSVEPEKDYRNFFRFTDRGLLFYTGHLAARPATKPEMAGEITLVAGADEKVVARGQPRGAQATLPMSVDGTYVYFGSLEPLETPDFVGLVDRGFPPAVRTNIDVLLPQFFAFLGEGLGKPAAASQKPLLFATYRESTGPGADMGGGVMPPRVTNFNFEMARDPSPQVQTEMARTMAHEIAHLWNADLYSGEDDVNETWMKEGSADVLAFHELRNVGALDERGYRERIADALALCLAALAEGEPLSASKRPGHTRDFYTCGATLTVLSAAASKLPVVPFLREVYAGPHNEYDGKRWFSVIEAHGADAGVVRTTAEGRLADPVRELPAAMGAAGIALAPAKEVSAFVQRRLSPFAARALLAPSCVAALEMPGNVGVWPRVTTEGACGAAAAGDRLTSFAGIPLDTRGADAFDAGLAQCKAKQKLTVGRKDKSDIELPCASSPRARTPYYEISRSP